MVALDLRRLRFLREFEERGTFGAVAAALGYSPSTVSQQLAMLEKEVGARLFEKAGVNYSEVHGRMSDELSASLPGDGDQFYATGVSLVLHPRHPRVPTVHANFRYIEKGDAWWFGGGADLTPYRLYEEDARHFDAGLRAGGVLVTVEAGARTGEALAILQRHEVDLGPRGLERYRPADWSVRDNSTAAATRPAYNGAERRRARDRSYAGPERRTLGM